MLRDPIKELIYVLNIHLEFKKMFLEVIVAL